MIGKQYDIQLFATPDGWLVNFRFRDLLTHRDLRHAVVVPSIEEAVETIPKVILYHEQAELEVG